jgi:hypothetical protein
MAGLRPGHLPAAADGHTGPALAGDVDLVTGLRAELVEHVTTDTRRIRAEEATDSGTETATVSGAGVRASRCQDPVNPGERCTFAVNASSALQFFDPDTSAAICS